MTNRESVVDSIPGIWHEVPRNRWRVKLCKDGEIYHRSYHHSYEEALLVWLEAKRQAMRPLSERIAHQKMTPVVRFLRQPVVIREPES